MTENMIRYEKDADGIVVLTMDDPSASANTMNEIFQSSLAATVEKLVAEKDDITGVVLTSAKKTFFAGGNLNLLMQAQPENAQELFDEVQGMKAAMRKLELLGKPVVAAINGAALGGGLEIALACHYRVAADGRYEIGLPEVMLGLLPGGGGVARVTRMLGVQNALMNVLLQGQRMQPAKAQATGLVNEIVPAEELLSRAKAYILENKDNAEAASQPWDRQGYKMPGGTPSHPGLAQMLPAFPAGLKKQLKGAKFPAPEAIMSACVEGAQVDFDNASTIESRYFVSLATGQNAKNMTQAFFFDLQDINSGKLRPSGEGVEAKYTFKKVAVLGAGMMGAGIAYVCAKAGMEVVLKDVSQEAADRGKNYSEKINEKAVSRGKLTQEKSDELLGRITPTADPADTKGCDLVIEAVFEDPSLKNKVFAEIAEFINPDALLCSNTSTLPITELAEGVDRPEDFIGLHFFSPVDKMPLVEIIRGAKTSDAAAAAAIDIVQAIKKTPIVVSDSRGFFTSRVIGVQINEGLAMLAEGVNPILIDRATTMAGYPVGPLQISDELNMELMAKIRKASKDALGDDFPDHPAYAVVDKMIEIGRPSKLKGAGFYEYDEAGKRTGIWKGLAEVFPLAEEQPSVQEIQDRTLIVEAIDTARCFEEGVLHSSAEANIGSIFGIGFPPATGGAIQFINGFEGTTGKGVKGFVARAAELEAKYGDRFAVPAGLAKAAAEGTAYPAV